ncbi:MULTISPECIES: phosphoribosylformylglycinamidine synthase subunit PurS [unclassified Deinococcus]|uniref:phosphoribosylformylglycinamidine synthase subunit PurS n=1 Tax=unclassified Deinococcus TaxID=2623546 RepID=UPI0006DC84FC|nr:MULTISPECIES: phosphoribosylformylglycinamidine synthase subunit PurS [unclassified Deinococcus]MCD0156328.1 phosphoribosylformylglycinamidine synthase subunit PurS [Deinococcus sp. 6GRE01]MCD0161480.1 phosphoribosylformylglycinamidine synthase subunit PurS [Deinococcus sp. 6YEL10]MCD0168450.1 phosphoribosylformylglycinamidine synthase subunit PurS [Deinococcus sp. 23YEL01]MCD0174935.1 phosphoribosylformylglycinamidine synthase subunit PurS [Deinococcus sp. 14RED07]OOV14612.1 phosphoribosyl
MSTFKAKVFVTLKPSILDPQGRTVERALSHLDHGNVSGVRVGKYIELTLSGSRAEVEAQLKDITENVLSNPVMEDARWELSEQQGEERVGA